MKAKSTLPGLPDIGKVQALEPLRRHPMRFTGPRDLKLQSDPVVIGGPGEPPEGFVTAHTSKTEWVWYWASAKVLKDPPDPRKPPFVGGANWSYQTPLNGGRVIGGQVTDFVYLLSNNKTLGVRIQTEHWHIMASAETQMNDFLLKADQQALDQIIDAFDQDWMWDPTGKAACIAVANAIKGIQPISPIIAGTAQRIRGIFT
jgi:hypothetical protein